MFIVFIITFILAAIAGGIWFFIKPDFKGSYDDVPYKRIYGVIALILSGLATLFLLTSSLTIVPANHVGVVTNFGAWSGTVDSGINWVKPWSKVDEFTTRNNRSIRDKADGNDNCVPVRAKNNASGCMDLTVLYTIDKDNAERLWRGWGGFDRLNSDLVNRATDNAVNLITADYAASEFTAKRSDMTDKISTSLKKDLSPQGVHLESITLGVVYWPDFVQQQIDSVIRADARVEVAQREEQAAQAEAKANAARQQSLTPEALIKACLDAAKEIKPAVFDCGLGSTENKPSIIIGGQR